MRLLAVRHSYGFRSFATTVTSASSEFNGDSFQYLERSAVPTMHFQPSLPRLPIPKLENTFQRYLSAVRPFFNDEQYEKSIKLINEFQNKDAKRLHEELLTINKRNKRTSYISEPWFDMYLKARVPLPLNFNPFMAWNLDPDSKFNDQTCRATNIIISACRFKRSLDANILEPEVFHLNPKKSDTHFFRQISKSLPSSLSWYGAFLFKAYPLDMSQFPSLFNTTRIPALGKDQLRSYPMAKHLIVMKKGHFFAVDVFNNDGTVKTPEEIHAYVTHINNMKLQDTQSPIGILTTMERDQWASLRSQLTQAGNEEQLQSIDQALFVLCLDNMRTSDPNVVAKNMIHGDGINRWYDKSLSVILHGDGLAAVNFEHSWGDGVAVLRFMEDIYKDTCNNHWVTPTSLVSENVDCSKSVRKLDFKLTSDIEAAMKGAKAKFDSTCANLQFGTLQYHKMDRDYIKKQKVSPDAVMQLAIQTAFYRMYGKFVPTYESCSTSAFKHGRTETVRPATTSTSRFVESLLVEKRRPSSTELRALIDDCSKVHSDLVKNAAMGQGFDRHLFVLRSLAERRGGSMPLFFADELYQRANHFILSTSTLSTETIMLGGFGPVVPDGFGVGYNVVPGELGCIVSAYQGKRNAAEFATALEQSLDDIKHIFEQTSS